jgi:uncharacterized protein (DUF302 family)
MTPDGMIAIASRLPVELAVERLEATIRARGMTVFARVDHTANAVGAGLELRPTTLVMFGDARVGTLLMQSMQTIGIDLPHRVLVWRDAQDQTWLAFNDPAWLAKRHGIAVDAHIVAMATALKAILEA